MRLTVGGFLGGTRETGESEILQRFLCPLAAPLVPSRCAAIAAMALSTAPYCLDMLRGTLRSPAEVSTLWPAPTIALCYPEDRRGADGPGRLEPEGCATIRPMACSTAPYCLGVWRDAKCTSCAVTTLSATRRPAQHGLQHPRPFLHRAWRWAVSPRVALPPRPWDD